MLKQLEKYSCSFNDAKRPPQTQLTVIIFSDTRWEKKLRYSSKHQTICNLLVKAGIQEKCSSPSWIPDYRIVLDSRILFKPTKKSSVKIISLPLCPKLQENQWNLVFVEDITSLC